MKKLILMDLDGVLNNYTGNYDANYIPVVKDGAKNFIKKLSEKYEIKLFTTRPKQLAQQWLSKHNLDKYIIEIQTKNKFDIIQRLMSHTDKCKVLSPDNFRSEIISILKQMKEGYFEEN